MKRYDQPKLTRLDLPLQVVLTLGLVLLLVGTASSSIQPKSEEPATRIEEPAPKKSADDEEINPYAEVLGAISSQDELEPNLEIPSAKDIQIESLSEKVLLEQKSDKKYVITITIPNDGRSKPRVDVISDDGELGNEKDAEIVKPKEETKSPSPDATVEPPTEEVKTEQPAKKEKKSKSNDKKRVKRNTGGKGYVRGSKGTNKGGKRKGAYKGKGK